MKTSSFLFVLVIALSCNLFCQTTYSTFTVKSAESPVYNPSSLLKGYDRANQQSSSSQRIETPIHEHYELIKPPVEVTEKSIYRTMAYYFVGNDANRTLQKTSIKVEVETINQKDVPRIVAYKNELTNEWVNVSYVIIYKTYGEIAKEYDYQATIGTQLMYFNL